MKGAAARRDKPTFPSSRKSDLRTAKSKGALALAFLARRLIDLIMANKSGMISSLCAFIFPGDVAFDVAGFTV